MSYQSVQEWFSLTAAEFSSEVAVVHSGGRTVTYAELEAQSNRLGNFLIDNEVQRGSMVGIFSDDPIQIVTSILGVLKAGAVFVPLDPTFPAQRLQMLASQVTPDWYITDYQYLEKLGGVAGDSRTKARVLCLDQVADYGATAPGVESDPEAPCSIYFSSGSTGKPKAILGRLKGIDHFMRWEIAAVQARVGTRVSQLASPSFDGFLKDVFVPLCAGGVVCAPASREVILDAWSLADWLDYQRVEVLHCVPSLFRSLLKEGLNERYFEALRYVVLTGEPLYPADVKRWYEVFGERIKLLNIYGTTETSLSKFHYEVKREDVERPSIPVGKPIKGAAVMIMDSTLQPCHVGAVGEIYIRTPYRSHGYYGEPELTKEVFIQNPFTDDTNDIVHKTGDYGRLLEDGSLEILGRRDQQVKVRGVRIELGEIENLLRKHEAIADVAVIDRDDAQGNKFLVAYITLTNGGGAMPIRQYLIEQLPAAMLPSAFVEMDHLPRTLNGKIDRKALPPLELVQSRRQAEDLILRTPVEEIVAGIWCEVLQLPVVGRSDNFFNLGGHSLLATQVILRIRDTLKIDLPVRSMFETSTVAELAQLVDEQISAGRQSELVPIEPVSREEPLPLSFAQQRMWFQEELTHGTSTFHLTLSVGLHGPLNAAALEQGFSEIIRRHENLRTTFPIVRGELVQIIWPPIRLALPVVDLSKLSPAHQKKVSERLAKTERNRPFDLETGPLARVALAHHSDDEHTIMCTLHHIISDGWSRGILIKEISTLYEAFRGGDPSWITELPIQYADYASWQRNQLQGDALSEELAYWKEKLADAPLLQLTDRPRPPVQTYRGALEQLGLSRELSEQLKTLSRGRGVTLFMTLLAAFQTLLARYTRQDDIIVGTSVANRDRSEIEGLIGFFVNMLPLRTDCSGNPPFEELLDQVRATTIEAYANQKVPFETLVQELQPKRNQSYPPLFQVVFSFQNQPNLTSLTLPELTLSFPPGDLTTSEYDLLLDMNDTADGLAGGILYNPDLFDRHTIAGMVSHFTSLLAGIVADPQCRLSELPLMSEEVQSQMLVQWNDTRREYDRNAYIHQLIESRAEVEPDQIAAVCKDEHVSYAELNRRANQLAGSLHEMGVKIGDLVGICIDHSVEELVGVLAVLKAGAGYVPLDPAHPAQRLSFILADAGVSVVLTQQKFVDALTACGARAICLDTGWSFVSQPSNTNLNATVTAADVAYVIYTSGSTGEPKGVTVCHQSLVNYISWARDTYVREERLDFPLYSSLAFDLTATSIYLPLITGNRVFIYPQESNESPFTQMLRENEVGLFKITPSHLSLIKREDNRQSRIKRMIVGGEALTTALAREVCDSFDQHVEIFNEYGPTEATVGCMIHKFDPAVDECAVVPIGYPAPNTQVYVLDKWLAPVDENMIGEMYIAGDCLANGYWNRKDLTAERFLPNPFATMDSPGARMYRTGDLARRLQNSLLEFVNRVDDQVKLRGFRIELGEIDAALSQYEGLTDSATVLREDVPGDQRLIAYVVPVSDSTLDIAHLQDFLKDRLPDYMVPAMFVQLENLPMTRNGKVDRSALPAPTDGYRRNLEVEYQEPTTDMESILALTWQEVLRIDRVGIYDNFFELGGHSLLAIQIIHRINQTFQVDLRMRVIFDEPTVAGLALLIEETVIERLEGTPELAR